MAKDFWRGGWGRFLGGVADAFVPGDAFNSNRGEWNPTTTQTGLIGIAAGQLFPGGDQIVGVGARNGLFGSDWANRLQSENTRNQLSNQWGEVKQNAQEYLSGIRPEFGGPQVSVGAPQTVSMGGPAMPGGLFDNHFRQNEQQAQQGMDDRMAQEMQRIQDRINGQGATNMAPVNANRPIGGSLSFGGGRFNNGVGAGTGYGGASFMNDAWGDVASGFGVGGMAGGSRDQVMRDPTEARMKKRV